MNEILGESAPKVVCNCYRVYVPVSFLAKKKMLYTCTHAGSVSHDH